MAIKTYTEQLEEVQAAITDLMSGRVQSISVAGRAHTMLDIDSLISWEKKLRPLASRESSGRTGPKVRHATPSW